MADDFDWEAIEKGIGAAATATDAKLNARISSLTRMTDAEVKELFPERGDKEKLAKLMGIVNGAASENQRTAQLVDNIQSLAGTAIKLLARFV